MNKPELPHLGARTIKTGLTVLICSLIATLILKRESASISCMAGIICIQNDIESSVSSGKNRIIGTILGAIVGFAVMFVCQKVSGGPIINSLIASIGTILTIYICTAFSLYQCILTACVMFLIIAMNVGEDQWVTYSIMRTIDTFVGVLVGVNVNKYFFKSSFAKVKKNISDEDKK